MEEWQDRTCGQGLERRLLQDDTRRTRSTDVDRFRSLTFFGRQHTLTRTVAVCDERIREQLPILLQSELSHIFFPNG